MSRAMRGAILHTSFGFLTPGEIARGLTPGNTLGRKQRTWTPDPIRFERSRGGTGAQKVFRDGLGDVEGTFQDQEAAFSSLNRQSRTFALQGNMTAANGLYSQAWLLWQEMGSPPTLKAELDYTQAVMRGDAATEETGGVSARDAAAAGEARLKIGLVNAQPDSVWGARLTGAGEGLREGAANVAKGKWFFGQDPLEKITGTLTDLKTPTPYLLLGLAYLLLRGK